MCETLTYLFHLFTIYSIEHSLCHLTVNLSLVPRKQLRVALIIHLVTSPLSLVLWGCLICFDACLCRQEACELSNCAFV